MDHTQKRPKNLALNITDPFGCCDELVNHRTTPHQVVGKSRIQFLRKLQNNVGWTDYPVMGGDSDGTSPCLLIVQNKITLHHYLIIR